MGRKRKSGHRTRVSDDSTQSDTDSSERRRPKSRRRHGASRTRDGSRRREVSPGRDRSREHTASRDRRASSGRDATLLHQPSSFVHPSTTHEAAPAVSPPYVDSNSNVLLSAFKELIQTMRTEGNSERYPVLNVIPEFDPAKRNQTIETWIIKVNECAEIYNWTEKQIIHYALPKLVGMAQKWYQGLPSLLFSWTEWQEKLKLAFPSDENYGQLLTDMLACKARFGDSLEEYFYQKMVLLNRCNITGKGAIDCVLFGIEDRSVRTSAEAAQFTEPDKLLVYLRNARIRKHDRPNQAVQSSNSDRHVKTYRTPVSDSDRTRRDYRLTKCYNCGEDGHPYFKCKQPIKRCESCHRVGHIANDCPGKIEFKNNNVDKTVLRISKEQDNDSKYFKVAHVNGQNLNCFVDFGSQCTMLQESAARNLVGYWSKSNLPVLRGFGDSIVNCLGRCIVEVEVDSVKANVEALVISDHLLKVPLLLGQTFTEQDHVIVYKTNDQLNFSMKPTENIKLYVNNSIEVDGYTTVDVYCKPEYSGDLFIEPSLCQNPQRNYAILQSVIRVEKGQSKIVIKSLNSKFSLIKDTLLLRALPLNKVETLNIDRIVRCPENTKVTEIQASMILVDDIGSEYISQLINLLNNFRECFAFTIEELGCIVGSEMDIKLNDTTPIVYRPYRLSHVERQAARDIIQELEDTGVIRQSSSNYASPIVLVRKKTGDYRLCIDFRALNKKTVKEHYPLPRIDDQLDNLSGYKYYTSLDLASGYYQIPMAEHSKHLTAFVTPDGHYEFNRMPFGLVNAPSTFQKTINNILGNARFKEAFAYMDDNALTLKYQQGKKQENYTP
ncbi:uncharacterized protein [Epargyreus clarus]|uniref:uncharacterized protein n=1 Tax=Epargyreus clarus TaxID=520877 RepID=UPI003C3098B6